MIGQGVIRAGGGVGGYEIPFSLDVPGGSAAKLLRTPPATDRRKWTFSTWFRPDSIGSVYSAFLEAFSNGSNFSLVGRRNTNDIILYNIINGIDYGGVYDVFLDDISKHYNVMVATDTTQPIAANRQRLYVDGIEITTKTTNYGAIPLNYLTWINNSVVHNVGYRQDNNVSQDGKLSDTRLIVGQQLTPAAVGEFDGPDFVPIGYAGTFGAQGFNLNYGDNSTAAALGFDTSGNGNNLTVAGLIPADQSTDTPTNPA